MGLNKYFDGRLARRKIIEEVARRCRLLHLMLAHGTFCGEVQVLVRDKCHRLRPSRRACRRPQTKARCDFAYAGEWLMI